MIIKLILLIFLFSINIFSQELEQYIFDINLDEPDYNYVESFEYYKDFPINIKSTNEYELSRLPDISTSLANNILNDLSISTWEEIKSKYNLSEFQIYIFESTIDFLNNKDNSYKFRTRYMSKLEDNKGITNNNFVGDKVDFYNRLGVNTKDFNFNLITNKDEGEKSYIDDYVVNLSYKYNNHKIMVGDFRAFTGLGLLLNSNFPIRKSSNPADALMIFGNGFSPSRSMLALGSFRGISYQNDFNLSNINFKTRVFYSNTARSSTIQNNQVTNIYQSLLFRTENEIKKKENLNEQVYFGNLEINKNNLLIGFNVLNYNYNKPLNTVSQGFYTGLNGFNYSFYSKYQLNNSNFNYEIASDNKSNISQIFIYNYFNKTLDFAFSYKYIHPNSRLQFNNILTNYSTKSNESGFFTYLTLNKSKYINTLFIDFFSRPKIDVIQDMPQSGIDIFDEFSYKVNSKFTYLTRVRLRNYKDFIKSTPNYFDKQRVDFRNEIKYNGEIDVRFRLDLVKMNFSEERYEGFGLLAFIEINKKLFKGNNTNLRFTYYDTDSYNEAIWHYEYLVFGYLASPPLYNNGYKIIFKSSNKILNYFLLSFAVTYDYGINFKTFGSGLNEIPKNSYTRFYLQMDYNLK